MEYRKIVCLALLSLLLSVPSLSFATDYFVNGSVAASGTGTSWAQAFKTIGEATTATAVVNIYVAGAEWPAPLVYAEQITIQDGVKVWGGFPASGSPAFNDRAPWRFVTAISGDDLGDDLPDFGNRRINRDSHEWRVDITCFTARTYRRHCK